MCKHKAFTTLSKLLASSKEVICSLGHHYRSRSIHWSINNFFEFISMFHKITLFKTVFFHLFLDLFLHVFFDLMFDLIFDFFLKFTFDLIFELFFHVFFHGFHPFLHHFEIFLLFSHMFFCPFIFSTSLHFTEVSFKIGFIFSFGLHMFFGHIFEISHFLFMFFFLFHFFFVLFFGDFFSHVFWFESTYYLLVTFPC